MSTQLVHSPEFKINITLKEGQMIMFNNWRTMHGRAGLKGKARTIIGGTVTKDGFVNEVRQMRRRQFNLSHDANLDVGLPLGQMGRFGHLHHAVRGETSSETQEGGVLNHIDGTELKRASA